jgi:hypothetical protein
MHFFAKETSHSQVQSLLFPWINSLNKALVEANQNIHLRPRQWACCTLEKRPNSSSISSESLSDGSSPVLRRFSFRSWRGSSRPDHRQWELHHFGEKPDPALEYGMQKQGGQTQLS